MFDTPKETEKDAQAQATLAAPISLTPAQIAEVAAGTASLALVGPVGTKGGIRVAV
jgi:hypothetical protein